MAFESLVPEDWRSAGIVPLYKCKGERTGCKNPRSFRQLNRGWKNKCGNIRVTD